MLLNFRALESRECRFRRIRVSEIIKSQVQTSSKLKACTQKQLNPIAGFSCCLFLFSAAFYLAAVGMREAASVVWLQSLPLVSYS